MDADDPDRFVWLRGFRDLPARAEALREFYDGPVWAAHRAAANATMIDSDDVLQLRPLDGNAGIPTQRAGLVVATIYLLAEPAAAFARFFEAELRPLLTATGAAPIARLVTEAAANNFPALPVREGEQAFVGARPLHLDQARTRRCAMGAGVFVRWRSQLGNQLDHGFQPPPVKATTEAHDQSRGGLEPD